MADPRGIIVPLVVLAFIFLSPEPARGPAAQQRHERLLEDVITEEQRLLSVLHNSSWDPLLGQNGHGINLTGLEYESGFAWDALPEVKTRVQDLLQYSLGNWGVQQLEDGTWEPNPIPLYNNVTGYIQGQWTRSSLQESIAIPQLNLSEYAPLNPFGLPMHPRPFERNITGKEGEISIRFSQKDTKAGPVALESERHNVTDLGVEVKIVDTQSYSNWELQLHGVYFVELGQAILATTSDKFSGIFALPHLTLSSQTFEESRQFLNHTISRVIQRQLDGKLESYNPWSSQVEANQASLFGHPECDLVMYLQQLAPVAGLEYSSALMSVLEHELRFPTGAVLPNAPDLRFSMLVFSPDCGFVLESKGPPDSFPQDNNHLVGPKTEVRYRTGRRHLLVFTLILALQLALFMRQMREASTPSTRSRISFYTFAMLALGDGFATMAFLLISLFVTGLWANLIGIGFLAFISVSFFGMRFLMDIWAVQAPERARRAREEAEEERRRQEALSAALQQIQAERQRAASNRLSETPDALPTVNQQEDAPSQPAEDQTRNISLPLPVTAGRPIDTGATPVFMPSDQAGLEPVERPGGVTQAGAVAAGGEAGETSFASMYTRFYFVLLVTIFLSLNAASWPGPVSRVYFTVLGLAYLSFWVPQIHRNVQRNCRHALNWEFVAGQSILRLMPFVYFYGYKGNILFTDVDFYSLAVLALWQWIQVVLLVSQELIGPRWFLRKDWAPPAYDYHPILRADEEGAMLPIGFSQATATAPVGSTPSSPVQERLPSSPTIARRSSLSSKEAKEKGKRLFDCAICMQDLEVPVIEAGASGDATLGGNLLARRMYMVTPCRHIFHSGCLEGWMKYRLQCPICRETLPPL